MRAVLESNLPEPAKALLAEVFRTGQNAKPDSSRLRTEPDALVPLDVIQPAEEAAAP